MFAFNVVVLFDVNQALYHVEVLYKPIVLSSYSYI